MKDGGSGDRTLTRSLRRLWTRWSWRDTALLSAALVLLAGAGLPLPGYAIGPGRTEHVGDLVVATDITTYPPVGQVLVSTIAVHPLTPFRALQAWLDEDMRAVPKRGVQSAKDRARAVEDSEQAAIAVVLGRLRFPVRHSGGGASVESVHAGSPAHSRLAPGDLITSVDGTSVSSSEDVIAAVRAHRPGELVRLDVKGPSGSARVAQIELGASERGEALLGVALRTEQGRFEYPVDVRISPEGIGGESAGLAFALGLLDVLTPGELTGGTKVAVTGTIGVDGRVGEVGSVTEKAIAARRAGARHFLVPRGQLSEALLGSGGRLAVTEVSSLDEALTVLGRLGGETTPSG